MSHPYVVQAARKLGFPVLYGDGSRPVVLETAGIEQPKAVMVMYTGRQKSVHAVERLRLAFPGVRTHTPLVSARPRRWVGAKQKSVCSVQTYIHTYRRAGSVRNK